MVRAAVSPSRLPNRLGFGQVSTAARAVNQTLGGLGMGRLTGLVWWGFFGFAQGRPQHEECDGHQAHDQENAAVHGWLDPLGHSAEEDLQDKSTTDIGQ